MSRSSPSLSFLFLASTLASAGLSAQGTRLSGDMPLGFDGDIFATAVAPDGGRVVYMADQYVQNRQELFSVPFDRSAAPVRLNSQGQSVIAFAISPDGARVVYRNIGSNTTELFSVPITGGVPVRLNGALVAGGAVGNNNFMSPGFSMSPDGTRVAYLADQDTNDVVELYSVPIDGSAEPVKLNGALVFGGDVNESVFSADGTRVVFSADANHDGRVDLFSALADGSQPATELSEVTIALGDVISFRLSPDRVVYEADQTVDARTELFSVLLDGSAPPVRLHTLNVDRDVYDFRITPDGSHVVFSADFVTAGSFELFLAPIDGSKAQVKLGATVGSSGPRFEISPDSTRVVYRTDSGVFSVPLDLSASAVQLGGPRGYRLAFGSGGARVVFDADADLDLDFELYSAPLDASTATVELSPAGGGLTQFLSAGDLVAFLMDSGEDGELFRAPIDGSQAAVSVDAPSQRSSYTPFQLTTDGAGLVFTSDSPNGQSVQAFSIPGDGSTSPSLLNDQLSGGATGDVVLVQTTADGRWAIYRADQETDEHFDLFAARSDGSGAPVRLNQDVAGDVFSFAIDPSGARVVYRADELAGRIELFSVPIDRTLPPLRLNDPLVPGGNVGQPLATPLMGFQLDPQGERVVFAADALVNGRIDLFSVPLDGSASPIQLNDPTTAGNLLLGADGSEGFAITPDGSRVVYEVFMTGNSRVQLCVVPIDGSLDPVVVSGSLVNNAAVGPFAILPDSSAVVFRADAELNERFELYRSSLQGSPSRLKLSATPVFAGDVSSFRVTPDGLRAVYLADMTTDELHELHSVRTDGSQPAVKLSGTLVAGGDVGAYAIAADGRVVYLADALADEVVQLFRVPSAGGELPTQLDDGPVSGGDVLDFTLSPTADRAFFRADQDVDEVIELYSVPLVGGTPPTSLSTFHGYTDVDDGFQVTRDGRSCLYLADQDTNGVNELYIAPADGSHPARKLNAALVQEGHVASFQLAVDRVLYRADQDTNGIVELYSSLLGHTARRSLR
jgi:Tol biopolymer transport system component